MQNYNETIDKIYIDNDKVYLRSYKIVFNKKDISIIEILAHDRNSIKHRLLNEELVSKLYILDNILKKEICVRYEN